MHSAEAILKQQKLYLANSQNLLEAYNPRAILKRGYALVRHQGTVVRSAQELTAGVIVDIELADGHAQAAVTKEAHGKSTKKS